MNNAATGIERRYLLYQVSRHLIFVGAVWLLFYRLFMSDQGVGLLDAASFGVGLLAEIPSGALADYFGRKKLVIIGIALSSSGLALSGFAGSYGLILFGQSMATIGWSLSSGADTAFFYDALRYDEASNKWKKLVAKGAQLGLITTLAAYLVGGYLYNLSPRYPFYASILALIGVLAFIGMKEQKNQRSTHDVMKGHVTDLKDGVKQLLHRNVLGYLPIIIILQGLFYTFGYGLLRPILQTRFEFGASASAWLLVGCGLTTFFLQRMQLRYIDKISEKGSIIFIGIGSAVALLLGTLPLGHAGLLVIFVLYAGEYLTEPVISDGLNKHIASKHRATSLSAASFLRSLPYVIVAPLIGYLNVRDKLEYYLGAMSILSCVAVWIYVSSIKQKGTLIVNPDELTVGDVERN